MIELGKGFRAHARIVADTFDMKSVGIENAAAHIVTLDVQHKINQALVAGFVKQLDAAHDSVTAAEARVHRRGVMTAGLSLALLTLCTGLSWIIFRAYPVRLPRAT